MYREEQEDKTIYKVVVNHEEQYSIWPADRENPLGWRDVGKSGAKEECLAYEELKQRFDSYFDTHAAGFERGTGGG